MSLIPAQEVLQSLSALQALHGPPSPELTVSMPLLLLPPLLPLPLPPPSSDPLSLPPLPLGATASPPLALALPLGTGVPPSAEPFHGGALLHAMSKPTAKREPTAVRFGYAIIATSSSISELLSLCPSVLRLRKRSYKHIFMRQNILGLLGHCVPVIQQA